MYPPETQIPPNTVGITQAPWGAGSGEGVGLDSGSPGFWVKLLSFLPWILEKCGVQPRGGHERCPRAITVATSLPVHPPDASSAERDEYTVPPPTRLSECPGEGGQ